MCIDSYSTPVGFFTESFTDKIFLRGLGDGGKRVLAQKLEYKP